jgi:hypothetical protein
MKDQSQSQLASLLTVGVGAWLMVSPLFIAASGAALVNTLIIGGIFVVAGMVQLIWTNTLPSWISAVAAIWLLGSAFIFNADIGYVWSMVLSAVAALVLAVWDGVEITHLQHSRHNTITS